LLSLPDSYRDKAADNFGATVLKLAHAIQLVVTAFLLRQYCLLLAIAASFKTVAISQNYLRPFEIQELYMISLNFINGSVRAIRKWCETTRNAKPQDSEQPAPIYRGSEQDRHYTVVPLRLYDCIFRLY
jgi:hypothetical protein